MKPKHENANSFLVRSSQSGKLMGEKGLGVTGETYLRELYILKMYGRQKGLQNKYVTKGLDVEYKSETLYLSKVGKMLEKNTEYFENDYFSGTPDLIDGDLIIDIKSSWDIFTFFKAKSEKINSNYYYQLQAYMCLTGKPNARLAYCLTDLPPYLLDLEKNRLKYEMEPRGHAYEEACRNIDQSLTYGDIPLSERVHIIEVPRNEADITKMKARVVEGRNWIDKNLFKA